MKRQPRYNKEYRIGGRYRVHQALMGGMGEVYLCLDLESMDPFALKTFQQQYMNSQMLQANFEEEVKVWIALEKHQNIVQCYWMQPIENIPFMALEWIAGDSMRGTTLREWLRWGPLKVQTALAITIHILRGLRHASAVSPGIVHRDLKPDNILMTPDGTAKITDFGLAKAVSETPDVSPDAQTDSGGVGGSLRVGEVVGTPPYMPPEQWRGEVPDFRADIYAVGCILYEMLTGKMAFPVLLGVRTQEEYWRQMEAMHVSGPRPRLPNSFSTELDAQFQSCVQPEVSARPTSVSKLIQAMEAIYEGLVGSPLSPEPTRQTMTVTDYGNRGLTYGNLGLYERAIQDFDAAIRLEPNLALNYYNRGVSYAQAGQDERARQDFNVAIQLDPTFSPAYHNRGVSYARMEQHERAIQDCDVAIQLDPNFAKAYYSRGASHVRIGHFERGIADLTHAIQLDPNYIEAYYDRAASYARLGQHDRAIHDLDTTIQLDPGMALAYFGRGTAYSNLGEYEHAIQDYDVAIQLAPDLSVAYTNRGKSYATLEQHERAVQDYDVAIQLAPTDSTAYQNRAFSYAQLEQHKRAIQDYSVAIKLAPADSATYFDRGMNYLALEEFELAIRDFDSTLQLNPYEAAAYLNKGVCLALLDRLQEAIQWATEAAQLGAPGAQEFVNQVKQMIGLPSAQPTRNDPQVAFEAYQQSRSLDEMRQTVEQFHILTQMIPAIEQIIQQHVPPEHRPSAEQRLAWLREIVNEEA